MEKNAPCNDDDELSFISLKAATLNVLEWLEPYKKQHENGRSNPEAGDSDEQKRKEDREGVDKRLREFRTFE
jgi:hypothetical protein